MEDYVTIKINLLGIHVTPRRNLGCINLSARSQTPGALCYVILSIFIQERAKLRKKADQ
jgi:hypothetical protein